MKCNGSISDLLLYRECRDKDDELILDLACDNMTVSESKLQLDENTRCWTLTKAGKNDSCLYTVWIHGNQSTPQFINVTVLDPVFILNITNNSNQLGLDIAVTVQFSGEETSVTWEVDGGPLPDRYRLIDDNRTLIILNAQRDDTERRFRVRVTNPVSEETGEYQLKVTGKRVLLRPHASYNPLIIGVYCMTVLLILYIIASF
ncbi:hypothetical protein PRIEUP_LOCUS1870 [Pristimantis euphronides]